MVLPLITITKEDFDNFLKSAPHDVVLGMMYSIAKYHERYRLTQWCLDALKSRGHTPEEIAALDIAFSPFYNAVLTQEEHI